MKQIINFIKSKIPIIGSFVGGIGMLVTLFGYISKICSWNNFWLIDLIKNNLYVIWNISVFVLLLALIIWIIILNRRFTNSFVDHFNKSLDKWDGNNFGKIVDGNYLCVTNSDEGGITKTGVDWENYTLEFRAKIIDSCLGVIIRAQSLDDYYMFQICKQRIVPHRRISYPKILGENTNDSGKKDLDIKMVTGWQVFKNLGKSLPHELSDWFDCRIKVNGQSISIFINNDLVFPEKPLLMNLKGKIGFRCWGKEESIIENVSVKLDI